MKTCFIALIALALPQLTWGQLITFSGGLDGPQSNTPSLGTGFASGTIDLGTKFFTLDYSFSGLLAPETAAHVHRGAPGVNGPVVIGAPSFPLGSPIHYTTFLTDSVINDLLNNNLYLNVHSTLYRGGEIRGQLIAAVPEPSTYALWGVAVLGVALYHRKRVRQATTTT